jgi:UMF1 family MFS transporter
VVAISAPILGAIADFSGFKKGFLLIYTALVCTCTALLFFVGAGHIFFGMLFFILAEIGYRSSQVFYNALLPEIAGPDEISRVSGIGWAIGSAGGTLCLVLVLGLNMVIGGQFAARLSLAVTAAFFAVSAIPIFAWVQERGIRQPLPKGKTYISVAFERLTQTFGVVKRFREFVKFIIAFLIYNDGIIAALDFAAILGGVLYGMEIEELIFMMVIVQVSSVVGAYLFGMLADRLGAKRSLVFSLLMMIALMVALLLNQTATGFFIIASLAGFALTGVQSVSRSMVGLLSPPGRSAEFYGFFAIAGRSSSFIGPTLFGVLAAGLAGRFIAQGQSELLAEQMGHWFAIFSVIAFLVIGLVLLLLVDETKGREVSAGPVEQVAGD